MTQLQIGLLLVQLAISGALLMCIGVFLLRAREENHKYRLYATRDKLLYLVANGNLPETSMVFKVFYRAMNTYVSALDSLTLPSFIQASLAVKTELEKENKERLAEALQRADPEVHAVIHEFIMMVMDALKYNSPTLTLILVTAHHCGRFYSFVRRVARIQTPAYDSYRYYESINGSLGLA